MDLPLLRILQSMKRMEDDPTRDFMTEEIDLSKFIPKYRRIFVVDQRVDPSQLTTVFPGGSFGVLPLGILSPDVPPSWMHLVTNALTVALKFISSTTHIKPDQRGWTIILKEGLYINPLGPMNPSYLLSFLRGESMEIVGLKDVRFLLTDDFTSTFDLRFVNLTLRNVRIYDRRENPSILHAIVHVFETECQLTGVRIHAPKASAVNSMAKGSDLEMKGCAMESKFGIACTDSGVIRAANCTLIGSVPERGVLCHLSAAFIATNMTFRGTVCVDVAYGSRCILDGCRFETKQASMLGVFAPPCYRQALRVHNEAELDCRRTSFAGYPLVVGASGSGTSVVLRHCSISGAECPFTASANANLSVTDSTVHSLSLVQVSRNVKGKVELLRNKFAAWAIPIVSVDSVSKKPSLDIKTVVYHDNELDPVPERTDKQRSKGSKLINDFVGDHGTSDATHLFSEANLDKLGAGGLGFKYCAKCGKDEQNDHIAFLAALSIGETKTTGKFRHCENCRAVCYCSKECQRAHWNDHRMSCADGKKGSKTRDKKAKSKTKTKAK